MPDAAQRKPVVWTIAGSDSSGGAGVQADLATFRDFGIHGCSVITALTAQNSFAVGDIAVTPRRNLVAQINALDSDLPAQAIKLGMLAAPDIVETVARYLDDYTGFVVCDPVIRASSGDSLLSGEAGVLLRQRLLPRADLITPNRHEAEALLGRAIGEGEDIPRAARELVAMGARSVLITGGHFAAAQGQRLDYWTDGREGFWLAGPSIDTVHTHGTGCTLSSAIAAAVGLGYPLADALVLAKAYVTRGLRVAEQLGGGPGAVAHAGWPDALADLPTLHPDTPRQYEAFPDCDGPLGLYPVVDSADWVEQLVRQGVGTVQLRIKQAQPQVLAEQVKRAVAACRAAGVRLFINDHWQLALEVGAYGVHLGQEDLASADLDALRSAGLRLGVSTHCHAEIARAHGVRPSYIALGPVYATSSKDMPWRPLGLEQLRAWVELLSPRYTLTAIGGISVERAAAVLATGVGSCAMISAITAAPNPAQAVASLLAAHHAAPEAAAG